MKRQPLSSTSLKEILEQDKAAEEAEKMQSQATIPIPEIINTITENGIPKTELIKNISDIGKIKNEIIIPISDIGHKKAEKKNPKVVPPQEIPGKTKRQKPGGVDKKKDIVNKNSEIGNKLRKDKADFQKVSFTLDPKMLWLLEDERRRRRVAKLDYSFSEIIREALDDFFKKLGRKIS